MHVWYDYLGYINIKHQYPHNVGPPVDSVQLVNITTISRLGL